MRGSGAIALGATTLTLVLGCGASTPAPQGPKQESAAITASTPPSDPLRAKTRLAIESAHDPACRADLERVENGLYDSSHDSDVLFTRGRPVASAFVRAMAARCRSSHGLGLAPSAVPWFVLRLLVMEWSLPASVVLPAKPDASTATELALLVSGANAPAYAAISLDQPPANPVEAARLELVTLRAVPAGDSSAEAKFAEVRDAFDGFGLVADAFRARIDWDGFLADSKRQADRLPLLDKAQEWANAVMPEEPLLRALLQNRKAVALEMLGRNDESLALNRETAALFEAEVGPHHPSTRRSRENIAVLLWKLGRYQESFDQNLAILAEHGEKGDDPAGAAVCHEGAAYDLVRLGRFEEAESHCRESMRIRATVLRREGNDQFRGDECLGAVRRAQARAH